jgi:hypothetical protein
VRWPFSDALCSSRRAPDFREKDYGEKDMIKREMGNAKRNIGRWQTKRPALFVIAKAIGANAADGFFVSKNTVIAKQ